MASGLFLTVMNYFLVGWFNGYLDKYYTESWKSWFYSYDVSIFVLTNCSPPLDLCRLHPFWKSHSCNYSLSSFRKKFCGGTTRKFQMGAHDAHFLRWPFLSPFACHLRSYVQHRHAMEYYSKGEIQFELLSGGS